MTRALVRPLVGVLAVAGMVAIVALAATMFRDGFAHTYPVTVLSPRAGLVMNPGARVQYRGVQVGMVSSIDELPDEQAAIHLAIDADRLHVIPANAVVNIASTTVFGAKFVQLAPRTPPLIPCSRDRCSAPNTSWLRSTPSSNNLSPSCPPSNPTNSMKPSARSPQV